MKSASRIVVALIGVLAVIATGVFVWVSFGTSQVSKGKVAFKGDIVGMADDMLAASAGATSAAAPAEAPAVPDGPLVFSHPGSSMVAYSALGKMAIYSSPGGGQSRTLDNPTREGMQLIFGVKEDRGDWLRVQLPVRPNGSTGWVKKSDVLVKTVPNHIVVETAKRRLSAWRGDTKLFETSVGVGTSKTPTPEGTFYVDFSVPNPGPGYGVHMLSVAGFSNVLRNFGGGTGQIAIHGTEAVHTVGQFSSNGCLRLTNADVKKLASIAAPGTPVFILP
ncbi:MAG TPA: L,D-transpeptidase [Actinomycetota bacterium]|nr:L,D-transpeptidase [Actinomycetota bacterium]